MLTLYYHAGACSTSNHIALEEAELQYLAIPVNPGTPDDPITIRIGELNPMGQLPILVLEDGTALTQNMATLPFIADLAPEKGLFPAQGTRERVDAERWLAFIAADLHNALASEYPWTLIHDDPRLATKARSFWESRVSRPLRVLEDRLAKKRFILGDRYSVIDGYALVVLNWSKPMGLSLSAFPHIETYRERVSARPAVRRVQELEGPLDW